MIKCQQKIIYHTSNMRNEERNEENEEQNIEVKERKKTVISNELNVSFVV